MDSYNNNDLNELSMTGQRSIIDELEEDVASNVGRITALEGNTVKITGDQDIAGDKTFTDEIIYKSQTLDARFHPSGSYVDTSTNQTVGGEKTFTDNMVIETSPANSSQLKITNKFDSTIHTSDIILSSRGSGTSDNGFYFRSDRNSFTDLSIGRYKGADGASAFKSPTIKIDFDDFTSEIGRTVIQGYFKVNNPQEIEYKNQTLDNRFVKKAGDNITGNLGIGVVSPSEKLEVDGNVFLSGTNRSLWIGGNTDDTTPRLRLHNTSTDSFVDFEGGDLIFRYDTTGKMRLTDNGRLGINQISPAYTLDVNGGGRMTTMQMTGVNNTHKIRFWSNVDTYSIGFNTGWSFGGLVNDYAMTFTMNNSTTRGFLFRTDSHTGSQGAVAITADGKLTVASNTRIGYGIADTTVPSTYSLDVNGNTQLVGTLTFEGVGNGEIKSDDGSLSLKSEYQLIYQTDWNGNNGGADHIFQTITTSGGSAVELMRLTGGGKLGLGTGIGDAYDEKLEVRGGNIKIRNDYSNICKLIMAEDATDSFIIEYDGVGTGEDNYVAFYSNVSTWKGKGAGFNYIPQTGRVGLGTNTPSEKLHLYSSTDGEDVNILLRSDGGENTGIKMIGGSLDTWFMTHTDATNTLGFGKNTSEYMTINSTGQLTVSSDRITLSNGGRNYILKNDDVWFRIGEGVNKYFGNGTLRTDGDFQVGSNGGTLKATNGGNVGIKTTSPSYALDVNGTIRAVNNIRCEDAYINGDIFIDGSIYSMAGSGELRHYVHSTYATLYMGVYVENIAFYGDAGLNGYIEDDINRGQINFTGQHRTFVEGITYKEVDNYEGLIVCSNKNEYISMSEGLVKGKDAILQNESLPLVSLCSREKDKTCFGVISSAEDSEMRTDKYGCFVSVFGKEKGDTRIYINSVGEGAIWVCNKNGKLEAGDYITTSSVVGYGQKQKDDILHNYTVAKITMDCDFNPPLQPKKILLKENGENVLDSNGLIQWTDQLDEDGEIVYEEKYKIRYVDKDGNIISKEEYDERVEGGNVFICAYVGATYHCG